MSTHAAVNDVISEESIKGLLPIALPAVCIDSKKTNDLVSLVKRLNLVGTIVRITINGFNSRIVMKTRQVSFEVSAENNNSFISFSFKAFIKSNILVGSNIINILELQEKSRD